jgi:hypothetical protein
VIGYASGRRDRVRGHAVIAAVPVRLSGRGRLCPGAAVSGVGVPGQEAFQVRAGEGLPVVAAAFVEVSGEVGQDVQAGHLRGGGDGPDAGGEACGVLVAGAAGVFLVTTGRRRARSAGLLSSPIIG